jgi:hypothetical protein
MRLFALLVVLLAHASVVRADIILAFDPADLTVVSTGADQDIEIDLLVRNDGTVPLDFSGITLAYTVDNPPLTPLAGVRASDFTFAIAPAQSVTSPTGGSFSASNIATNVMVTDTFQKLGSLQFELAGSFIGTTPLSLNFTNASEGFGNPLDASDFNLPVSTIVTVTAVPEPSTMAYGWIVVLAGVAAWRKQRRA